MLEKEVVNLKNELTKATQAGSSVETTLRSQLKKADDEVTSLR